MALVIPSMVIEPSELSYSNAMDLRDNEKTSKEQPRSQGLSSLPPLSRWNKDPGCGWTRDHPESGW